MGKSRKPYDHVKQAEKRKKSECFILKADKGSVHLLKIFSPDALAQADFRNRRKDYINELETSALPVREALQTAYQDDLALAVSELESIIVNLVSAS